MRFLCKSWVPVERLHRYFGPFFDKNGFLNGFAYTHNPSGNSEKSSTLAAPGIYFGTPVIWF